MARYRRFDDVASGVSLASREVPSAPDLSDVRMRRAGLKAAMSGLEIALAAAAGPREDWLEGVASALHALHEVWTRHIVETEAPGAFLDELVADAPRLSKPVSRVRREHNEILATIKNAQTHVAKAPLEPSDDWVDETRSELTSLLVSLARHRQRGADLVYEAFDVDIGGGF